VIVYTAVYEPKADVARRSEMTSDLDVRTTFLVESVEGRVNELRRSTSERETNDDATMWHPHPGPSLVLWTVMTV
jgi:hypothetical protein